MTEEWRNEVYENADFDKEYGMLAYTFAEVQNAAKPATSAVQNYIASKVRDRFQNAYQRYYGTYDPTTAQNRARTYGDRYNTPLSYKDYFARNRQAYLDVLSQPIDLSLAGMTKDQYGEKTAGEMFPTAFNQTTVGGAMNWLTMSEIPGMLTSLAKPIYGKQPVVMGPDNWPMLDDNGMEIPDPNREAPLIGRQASNYPTDELNAAWMQGYETIHLFEPGAGSGHGNFTVWFNQQAKRGIDLFRKAEKAWRSGSTPMSYAMGGDDGGDEDRGGGLSIDGNSGDWGDGAVDAMDGARGIGDISRYSTLSKMPMSKSTGAPLDVLNAIFNMQQKYGEEDGKRPWTTFNVKTGRYGNFPDANTLQVWGIDPDSPAGKAGMKEGAFINSLARVFSDPELPTLVDALQNGQPINLNVRQQNDAGAWVNQVLTINPGSMAGRGINPNDNDEPHFIEKLADYVQRSSMQGVNTELFTTDERNASGMYQDKQGDWHLSPMRRGPSETHNVPVTLSPQAMRHFIPLYEDQRKTWREYDSVYNTHYRNAYKFQLERYIKANHQGTKLETPFLDAVREMTLKTLPRDIPRPGTELYQKWQSGQNMLEEIRTFEDNIGGAPSSGDFYDKTIEQWDAWASSMERYKNSGSYGYVDSKRLAQAQAEVVTSFAGSRAGNYLQNQKRAISEGVLSHLRNTNPGGATLGKTLRPDENGELRKFYPEMAMFRPYLNAQRVPFTPVPRKTIAQHAADRELYYTVQQAPVQGNPAGSGFDMSGLSQQTDSAYMFPRAPGRGKRLIENLAAQRRAGTPAPDYQGNPSTGPILPARPTGKYKDPAPRPWYQPPGPNEFVSEVDRNFSLSRMARDEGYAGQVFSTDDRFIGDQAELELAAYSHISNKNALSAFPQGSMNEDDFDWTTQDARPREEAAPVENTYDTSVMGGDPERMVESDGNMVGMGGDPGQFLTEGYFRPYKMEGANVDVIGGLQRGETFNDGNAVPDENAQSVEGTNWSSKRGRDRIIDKRMRNGGDRDEDREMEGVSDEIFQGESERRFAQAWEVIRDPKRMGATLSEIVSSAGNALGFLKHSKADWGRIFTNFSERDKTERENASYATYHALKNADNATDQMQDELIANVKALSNAGRKRSVVLTRLGESPELANDMVAGRNQRRGQYYREALKQVSEEVAKKYGVNLSYQVGQEADLYGQLETLRKENPEAFQMVKGVFAPLADQLKASRKYVEMMNTVPAATSRTLPGNTPTPQRVQNAGDSHVFRGPDGKGKAMLKYSPNQMAEMRGRRAAGINPETGEFDPFALENTPVSAQVRARGGGGSGWPGWSRPDYHELNALQNSITYRHFGKQNGDDQAARLGGQVETYKDEYIDRRKRFDLIMPYDADADQDGTGLQSLLETADAAVRGSFGQGFDIGQMEEVSDPDLPAGFVRMGAAVRREGEGPEYVNDFAHDPDPGEPPEAPPPPGSGGTGTGSSGGGSGNPPPGTTTATPDPADANDPTPQPARSNGAGPGRTPKPRPNTDPAAFPVQPGGEGWRMQFSRYDPTAKGASGKKGGGRMVTAWGRRGQDGELRWYEMNAEGKLEALQLNKGFGQVYDEKGTLLHDVDRNAALHYRAMNAEFVSSDGNSPGGNATPASAREPIRSPEEWASFKPEAGMMLVDKTSGYEKFRFAVEDPDNPGSTKWVTSAREGGIQDDAKDPGWGKIIAPDGSVIADVPQHKYEIYANEQGRARSAENKRLREEAKAEGAKRQQELKDQRRVANTTPAPSHSGFSASFGRFNNAMWDISGQNISKFLQSHSPTEFGESSIGENTKLAAMNEYLGQVTHLYNSYIDQAPTSAQQVVEDIMDMTGASEDQAKPIAEALYEEHDKVMRGRAVPLKKQNPMKRSMDQVGRLNEVYNSQDVGQGPLGMRSHVQNLVGDVAVRDIDGFKSPSLGEGAYYPYIDAKGEQRYVPRIAIDKTNAATGETGFQTTVNENQIAKGLGWAQNAFNSAFSGSLPSSPDAILATLKERMYTEMNKQMKAEIDNAVSHGTDKNTAGASANIIKEIGDHFIQKIVGKVKQGLDETVGEASGSAVAEGTRYDTRIKTLDDLKAKMASDRVFAAEFKGRSAEDIHAGDEMIAYDSDRRSFKVGGSGDSHYGTKSRFSSAGNSGENLSGTRGMFGKGSAGSLMYGAYMLKREWQMATGATFAAATSYGEGIADFSGLLYSGSPMGGSDMGFAYRQETGESFMGKAAYSQWGAFMDIPYRLSETGNMGAARLLQTAGIAGGLAMGGAIGGSMLAGTALAAAAPVLATGGLVLGGALLAGTAAMEAYNAFNPEDAPDLTLSTIVSETEKETARQSARVKRKEALYGQQAAPSGAEMSAFVLAGGSQPHSPAGQSSAWAARTEMNKYDKNKFVTDKELMEYMTPEEKQLWVDEEMNKKAEALAGKVREIRGDTLEDKNTLIKGLSAQKWYMGSPDPQMLGQVSAASVQIGVGSDQSITEGATYAQQLGYLAGTPDFTRTMYQYALTPDRVQRQQMQYTASRVNQFGSQIQSLMGTDGRFAGQGSRIAQTYNFQNQSQVGAYTSIIQGLQQQGAELAPWRFDQLANLSQQNNPFVSNMIGNAMEGFMSGGGSVGGAVDLGFQLSSAGMTTQDASVYGRMMQGDLHAYSYQAWQSGNLNNAFFDKAGRSITQYNGSTAMQVYNHWAPTLGKSPMTASQFLGTNNQQILDAWNAPDGNGGFYALQKLANAKSYAASMASIGIQLKGIALSENFYWGANSGGTWNNPSAHSAWGIEDQMLQLQDASTRAGFEDQWTRMTRSNQYAVRREDNQFQRMNASQSFQNFQWSYSYNQFQQSQQWAQEDWGYQDTMRGLSFGWQMEDLNEQIRFASGRQRKQLVKQRDRAALTHNIEDEQVETTRDRQKELWAQQEEQFQKQREYNLELQRLDQESFQTNREQREEFYKLDVQSYERRVKEYEEEKKLQDELRELQRKFQYDQLQLQKEAAGAQAAAAAAQKEINDAILEGQKNWETLTGEIEQMNTYNNAYRIANATNEMMRMIDNVNVNKINKILELIRTIGTVDNPRWGGERD